MSKIMVLMQMGKSISTADSVKIVLFDSKEKAEEFCEARTDLDTKYWTYCSIIDDGEEIELYYNN